MYVRRMDLSNIEARVVRDVVIVTLSCGEVPYLQLFPEMSKFQRSEILPKFLQPSRGADCAPAIHRGRDAGLIGGVVGAAFPADR
jgi:hypothetical protein